MTNWKAMQSPVEAKSKQAVPQLGLKPRYMAMGSWHADSHKGGKSRKLYKTSGIK